MGGGSDAVQQQSEEAPVVPPPMMAGDASVGFGKILPLLLVAYCPADLAN
jgi:hypothetical protein